MYSDNESRQRRALLALRDHLDLAIGDATNWPLLVWLGVVLDMSTFLHAAIVLPIEQKLELLLKGQTHKLRTLALDIEI